MEGDVSGFGEGRGPSRQGARLAASDGGCLRRHPESTSGQEEGDSTGRWDAAVSVTALDGISSGR